MIDSSLSLQLRSASARLHKEVDHLLGGWEKVAVRLAHDQRLQTFLPHCRPDLGQRPGDLAEGPLGLRSGHRQYRKYLKEGIKGV